MILIAYSILAVVYSLGMLFMQMHMPRSYYFIGFLLNFLMTTGLRFSYRLMRFWVNSRNTNADAGGEMHAKDHVMVIGAGAAGQALIKEIINSKKLNTQVVCIIDDNPTKHGRVLEGITIVGDRYSIPEMAKKYKGFLSPVPLPGKERPPLPAIWHWGWKRKAIRYFCSMRT